MTRLLPKTPIERLPADTVGTGVGRARAMPHVMSGVLQLHERLHPPLTDCVRCSRPREHTALGYLITRVSFTASSVSAEILNITPANSTV